MAEDQVGMRKEVLQQLAPWTKLFSAFKVALDPKKLLLAGAGILVMQLGWWVLAMVYFGFGSDRPPDWPSYASGKTTPEQKNAAWQEFKRDRQIWNLKYEMAGTLPTDAKDKPPRYDIGDKAESPSDYEAIEAEQRKITGELLRLDEPIKPKRVGDTIYLTFGPEIKTKEGDTRNEVELGIDPLGDEKMREALLADLTRGKFHVRDLDLLPPGDKDKGKPTKVILGTYEAVAPKEGEVAVARAYKQGAKSVDDIRAEIKNGLRNARITNAVLELRIPKYKPYGRLRILPWFEERGANPYLLVTGNVHSMDGTTIRYVPWAKGEFLAWVVSDEVPVLLEPLIKFFRPIIYLFDPAGGFWNRVYLFLVIAWSLATWALFGGAITRIAAVQVARANERVSMTEALRFTWVRYKSYFCAPLFPLLFLFFIAAVLFIFGLLEAWTFVVGDIVGGLLWPLALLAGLIMAVVLVGLVGWPLMYTTISAEGSDSFDAISRSYSYVYQAPWHYLWYTLVALVYGAVLIFFVGLMGSLMVYMSKWAVTLAPTTDSREPSYLFQWAPTSYGWRDLLLYKSPNSEIQEVIDSRGNVVSERAFSTKKENEPNWHNYVGTFFVTIWLYLLFLLVIGFGYSYFWTASTIIYLLMRKKVDETELDEIHLEEEPEQPFPAPAVQPPAPSEAIKPHTTPVTMVESPTLRSAVVATPNAPAPHTPEPSPPPASAPVASAEPAPLPAPAPPTATPEPAKEPPPGDGSAPAGGTH
jgi:hypothetical protein